MRTNGRSSLGRLALGVLLSALLCLALPLPSFGADPEPKAPAPAVNPDCAAKPVWVTLDGWRVLELRSVPGAQKLDDFAARASRRLRQLARDDTFQPSQLVVRGQPPYTFIGIDSDGTFLTEMAVEARGAACFGLTPQALAERYRDELRVAIARYRKSNNLRSWLEGMALALLVLGVFVLWLRLQLMLNRRIRDRIQNPRSFPLLRRVRLLHQLLDAEQARGLLQRLRAVLHWSLLLLISYLLIPLLLGFFPPTEGIANGLRSQILDLVGGALGAVVAAIPDLLSMLVILAITVLLIRTSNAWFSSLDRGHIRLPGFYPEWALPTARLAAILITLMGLALAYPYIPGSNSKAFQGAGLLLGVLAALGSSAIATNIISGLMLIYTRAFRDGDRVEINGTVGVVQERALLVTRVKTPRNELVSIPNATVISSSIVNFSFSRREIRQPVAIAPTITIGYDVPWRQVHGLMLAAARATPGITEEIKPYVLQTALNDFHISYELNAFVKDAGTYRETLSELLAALQDQFAAADVEILSPGYHAIRNGNRSTVPKPDA
ncbi:mechanosensitive ion channel family protein [Cyanobium gracile]|uniref:Mechanosensitive ion channel domain-containing protein n=1 Tax=Cyanobium gracile UHCC 0281 TaxID=3110309 RepID=A0ABU5STH2_9CYAN|nr:mechanosensitive ion channel domain-containing protein [Cyanobium gracile]MEA5441790.1 mechanosensitive ion channel domain-containing protein [Cyanobium gracile UHCC 0281]